MGNSTSCSKQNQLLQEELAAEVISIKFVTRPLDSTTGAFLGFISKRLIGHYAVIVKAKFKGQVIEIIIHNNENSNVSWEYLKNEQYTNDGTLYEDDFLKCLTVSEIFLACKGHVNYYDLEKNNCVHAINRIKAFLKPFCSSKEKIQKVLQETNIPSVFLQVANSFRQQSKISKQSFTQMQ